MVTIQNKRKQDAFVGVLRDGHLSPPFPLVPNSVNLSLRHWYAGDMYVSFFAQTAAICKVFWSFCC